MTLQHFPVKHSTLDENALAEWTLSCYPLREPVRCRFLRKSMSDVYLIDTRDAAYILKVYMHNRHSRHSIEAEVGFLNDLLDRDIPVAAPIANNDAAYLNEIDAPEGTRYAVLFDAITGDEPQETNLNHSRRFGQLAGRMHNCADRLANMVCVTEISTPGTHDSTKTAGSRCLTLIASGMVGERSILASTT